MISRFTNRHLCGTYVSADKSFRRGSGSAEVMISSALIDVFVVESQSSSPTNQKMLQLFQS